MDHLFSKDDVDLRIKEAVVKYFHRITYNDGKKGKEEIDVMICTVRGSLY